MTTQQMHNSSFKVATLAGLTGAGLALLFAPRSGRETRERIRASTRNMKQQAGDKAQVAMDMKDQARQAFEAGKRSAQKKYKELRDTSKQSETEESMPSDLPTNNQEEI